MGVFKLGRMTFGSLFKKPETVLYPVEQKPQPAGLKGKVVIDESACILCGMCERSCSTDCIKVDKAQRYWEIDRFQCVQCGYCITVCPKKCLSMDPNYAAAATVRSAERIDVPEQEKPEKAATPAANSEDAPAKEAKAVKPAESAPAAAEDSKAAPEPPESAATRRADAVLEAKIALLDDDKAQRVREALAKR